MDKNIIFVNGIGVSMESAEGCRRRLNTYTRSREVRLHFNESMTYTTALLESIWLRWFYKVKPAKITQQLVDRIRQMLRGNNAPLYLIGHSEGTAIANNAVALLNEQEKSRIVLILFAPVNSFNVQGVLDCEKFLNKKDYVVTNLILGNRLIRWIKTKRNQRREAKGLPELFSPHVYLRDGSGHSLLSSYWAVIDEFKDYETSHFHELKNV